MKFGGGGSFDRFCSNSTGFHYHNNVGNGIPAMTEFTFGRAVRKRYGFYKSLQEF